jgi:signal transduction histidine kinase
MVPGRATPGGLEPHFDGLKLMDFGLAVGDDVSRMTQAGALLGTIAYMAPEVVRGLAADAKADVWALGVVAYELVSGRPPFVGNETAMLQAILNDAPAPLQSELGVPAELADLITLALQKDPSARPEAETIAKSLRLVCERVGAGTGDELPLVLPEEMTAGSDAWVRRSRLETPGSISAMIAASLDRLRQSSSTLTRISSDDSGHARGGSRPTSGDSPQQLIYGVAAVVAKATHETPFLGPALEITAAAMDVERALVLLVDATQPGKGHLELAAQQNHDDTPFSAATMPLLHGLVHRAIDSREALAFRVQHGVVEAELQAAVVAPIWSGDSILGALVLERITADADAFHDSDLETLACVGYLLGLGLQRDTAVRAFLKQENLAAAGKMLAGVTHDINNTICALVGGIDLMLVSNDKAEAQELASAMREQLDEMSTMTQDLLAFVRKETRLRVQPTELAAVARAVAAALESRARDLKVSLAITHDHSTVALDDGRLKRILVNLGKNALDVLAPGGRVAIELRRTERPIDGQPRPGLEAVVRDNGPGIAVELLPRIFDDFFTHGKAGGTGLGLAIVKRFTQDHGGIVTVDSSPGHGATFTVWLPESSPSA